VNSVCLAMFEPSSFDCSNYMYRALIRVAHKFAHELSVCDILKRVNMSCRYAAS